MKVLVVGGTRGIGYALAKHFKSKGAEVGIVGRSYDLIQSVARELDVVGCRADVGCEEGARVVLWACEALGGIDVVINTAGMFSGSSKDLVATNVLGAFDIIEAAVKVMGSGSLVLLSGGGVGGPNVGKDCSPLYAASKAAVVTLVECMARENPHVRINAVAPGLVKSDMRPDGKEGPSKAVELIDWLCSDAAKHLTGRLVAVRDPREWWDDKRFHGESDLGRLRRTM